MTQRGLGPDLPTFFPPSNVRRHLSRTIISSLPLSFACPKRPPHFHPCGQNPRLIPLRKEGERDARGVRKEGEAKEHRALGISDSEWSSGPILSVPYLPSLSPGLSCLDSILHPSLERLPDCPLLAPNSVPNAFIPPRSSPFPRSLNSIRFDYNTFRYFDAEARVDGSKHAPGISTRPGQAAPPRALNFLLSALNFLLPTFFTHGRLVPKEVSGRRLCPWAEWTSAFGGLPAREV